MLHIYQFITLSLAHEEIDETPLLPSQNKHFMDAGEAWSDDKKTYNIFVFYAPAKNKIRHSCCLFFINSLACSFNCSNNSIVHLQ